MLDNLIYRILLNVNHENYFTEIQLEQIKYSILAIGGDLSKFLILFVVFSTLGYCPEYLYAFFTTTILRLYIGGKHYHTYLGCLLFSTIYFTALIVLTTWHIMDYYFFIMILAILSAAVLVLIAPRVSRNSGRNFKMNFYKVKFLIVIIVTSLITVYIVKKEPIYAIGPFTIMLQTIQLLTMKGESYYEIRKETKAHF